MRRVDPRTFLLAASLACASSQPSHALHVAFAASPPAILREGPSFDDLQPATTRSASGVYALFQDPSDPLGRGPARMTLSRGGRTVWSAVMPFTLKALVVTDDGALFGWSESEPNGMFAEGEVRVAIVSPRGALLRFDAHPRRGSRVMHGDALPALLSIYVDSERARGVVRVSAPDETDLPRTEWWIYELRTGAVLQQGPSRPSAWTAPDAPAVPSPSELELRFLGAVTLDSGAELAAGPIRDVSACAPGAEGELRFLRPEEDRSHFSAVGLDAAGELASETPFELPQPGESARVLFAPLPGADWLVARTAYVDAPRPVVWRVDGASGNVSTLCEPACSDVSSIDAAPDGGFALLGDEGSRGTSRYGLFRYDAAGALRWKVAGTFTPPGLFAANEVAVAASGEVAVLATVGHRIWIYSDRGELERELELDALAGRELNYPSDLVADRAGGLLVRDFDGEPPLWYLSLDGSAAEPWGPRDAAARAAGASILLGRFAEDGTRWASDKSSLMQLDERGQVLRRIGSAPSTARIDQPGAATIDSMGRVLLVDGRTAAVHLYDGAGRLVQVGRPVEGQMGFVSGVAELTASARGQILVRSSPGPSSGLPILTTFARFDETGEFLGLTDVELRHPSFVADSEACWGERWGERGSEMVRLDARGEVEASHPRRPDHRFWSNPALAAGRGDELAVVDDGALAWFDDEHPDGALLEMPRAFDFPRVADGGRWIAVHQYGPRTLLLDTHARTWWSVDLGDRIQDAEKTCVPFGFSADRSELLALDKRRRTLLRYALPID